MARTQTFERSPVPLLQQRIAAGIGAGSLRVLMARAGVGKSALLVQIGLYQALQQRNVLHLALGQSIEHVQAWYDALLEDLLAGSSPGEKESCLSLLGKHRILHAQAERDFSVQDFTRLIGTFSQHLVFSPQILLVDGLDWSKPAPALHDSLTAIKALAQQHNMECWLTAQTTAAKGKDAAYSLPSPCGAYQSLIDVAVLLEPRSDAITIQVLKGGVPTPPSQVLEVHADTLRLATKDTHPHDSRLPRSAYVLLSGGAEGAEAFFGACAESHGINEINFSFPEHKVARTRGLVLLSDSELRQGDISWAYLTAHMHRNYPQTAEFRKVLQSIWHQVHTASEVFAVGTIKPDKTVSGGTGWAVELARHWEKPVYVFAQDQKRWFRWQDGNWIVEADPVIHHTRFAGTGTRSLNDDGKRAISDLFMRTFGSAPNSNPGT